MDDRQVREILIEKDKNFRALYLKHQEYDQQLETLSGNAYKTNSDIQREQNLKKMKLKMKDAMQKVINEFRDRVGA